VLLAGLEEDAVAAAGGASLGVNAVGGSGFSGYA
jgi:hypothetical protein